VESQPQSGKPLAPIQTEYAQASDSAKPVKAKPRAPRINDLVKSRLALRQGLVMSEILGKPVALRDEYDGIRQRVADGYFLSAGQIRR
jgi:hypothetical protein